MRKRLPRGALLALATLAASILVPQAARAATTASIDAPAALTSSDTITFSSNVWHVNANNVVLRVQGTTTNLGAALTCFSATNASVGCALGPVRTAVLKPASALIPGQRYRVIVNPTEGSPPPVQDYLLVTAVTGTTKPFIASLFEEENSVAASYTWGVYRTSSAYGGSYWAEQLQNASVTFGITGRNFTWYTETGPSQGIAAISVDGRGFPNVNLYAPTTTYKVARLYRGFASGYHRVTIKVLGLKGSPNGKGTWVSLDQVAANGAFASPHFIFQWQSVNSNRASGGHSARANTRGAQVRFTFRGRSIDWITVTGPSEGAATMFIDGVKMASVNNHASSVHYGVIRRISNLSDVVHSLDVVAGGGAYTSVDRFVVRLPDLTIFKGLGTWVDLFDYGTSSTLDPTAAVPDMKAKGVRTIYIETARYNSSSAFDFPAAISDWIEVAHANGMKIVGWYLPIYGTSLNTDVSRTVAIATYRSTHGQGFDGLGIDIESKQSSEARSAWFADIATHLARVRNGVTAAFPIGAITYPPLVMDMNPSQWSAFPWAAVGQQANIVLPMGYWSYRTDCSTNPQHCPYQYTLGNINEARTRTSGLPVHIIGGIADSVTVQGVTDFMKAAHDARAYGASLYDYRTTTNAQYWTIMAGANTL
ncbi:MAG TPA: hypothetical protein VKV69_05830 [Actinomycetota bacterium]|nr:hypothetical protein [Actinomycetota bacterium]